MDKITITRHLTHHDTDYVVSVDVTASGCSIVLSTGSQVAIPWSDAEDVERLSDIFSDVPVFMFKFLIGVIAQAVSLRHVC